MSAHTPGPWFWVQHDDDWWTLEDTNGGVIADDGSACGEYARNLNPEGADARLIAAAPDLLEALESVVLVCEANYLRNEDEVEAARALLAKLKGE